MIKFLVVDDEVGVSGQLKDFLEERGYNAIAATSGAESINNLSAAYNVIDTFIEGADPVAARIL